MRVGTKSLLYGAHQVLIHPWFVALAWWKLYGFPFDFRLWVAFFVHDLGYWGKPNMDGPEGEEHPRLGARIMGCLFDRGASTRWHDFALYHSRFLAKRAGAAFSRLCVADKLAIALTPAWLYLPMVRATGEIREYMALAQAREASLATKYSSMRLATSSEMAWYLDVQEYLRRWCELHRDGGADQWTPDPDASKPRVAASGSGVWR